MLCTHTQVDLWILNLLTVVRLHHFLLCDRCGDVSCRRCQVVFISSSLTLTSNPQEHRRHLVLRLECVSGSLVCLFILIEV